MGKIGRKSLEEGGKGADAGSSRQEDRRGGVLDKEFPYGILTHKFRPRPTPFPSGR